MDTDKRSVASNLSEHCFVPLIGTQYGGDGRSTMGVPNLQNRAMIGLGQAPGFSTTVQPGQVFNTPTIPVINPGAHTHVLRYSAGGTRKTGPATTGDSMRDSANIFRGAAPTSSANVMASQTIGTGGGGGIARGEVQSPKLGFMICMALEGIYPSRS